MRSVAAQVGFCELDRRRLPLRGDEQRACWETRAPAGAHGVPQMPEPPDEHLAPILERPVYRLWDDAET